MVRHHLYIGATVPCISDFHYLLAECTGYYCWFKKFTETSLFYWGLEIVIHPTLYLLISGIFLLIFELGVGNVHFLDKDTDRNFYSCIGFLDLILGNCSPNYQTGGLGLYVQQTRNLSPPETNYIESHTCADDSILA